MDVSCMILSCILLMQMALILVLLNPIYDVRKVTKLINTVIKNYRAHYCIVVLCYFLMIIYLGMFLPLHNVHRLIFGEFVEDLEKVTLLRKVEKNYIIAGFSLFLIVVIYGIRALITYTAYVMAHKAAESNETLHPKSEMSNSTRKALCSSSILPNLLRMKRSISYDTILFAKDVREYLKNILHNTKFPTDSNTSLTHNANLEDILKVINTETDSYTDFLK